MKGLVPHISQDRNHVLLRRIEGNMRAAMVEEINRVAIALVEVKQVETVNIEKTHRRELRRS